MPAVIAIDQGTTGSKAYRLDADGRFSSLGGFEHRQIYPQPGWVEHDALELLDHLRRLIERGGDAAALGIDNQGETVVAWDGDSGEPLGNAIVWQDARSLSLTEKLKAEGAETLTIARAGLPLDPYFSASKLRWIIDELPEAKRLLARGRLRLGTSDSFFLDRLAGIYATDVTTASRTSLMNLGTGQWDPELCRLFGIPLEILPEIRATAGDFGSVGSLPLRASLVDQQAALFGHGCRHPGQAKITFGTGAFALCVAARDVAPDEAAGMNRSIAWRLRDGPLVYALEGGIYNAASAVNWARGLGLFSEFAEIESFAGPSALERGLVFVPALSGLSVPYWDRNAAGLWLGMGLETSRGDMMQALLEGIALLAAEVIAAMDRASPLIGAVSIDGGLSNNGYFCDFLARVLQRPVQVPSSADLTGLGTAQMAMIGAGLAGPETLPPAPTPRRLATPAAPLDPAARARFTEAVARARNWR
ncbi:MAG TPA: FGGY family carbohydrate kinase [Verrucomicrobiae bacterium]|nr:FGGY family carbohydrate kinase [Verrucomicrobiae bacterium]